MADGIAFVRIVWWDIVVGGIAGHRVAEETGWPDARCPWDCVPWDCLAGGIAFVRIVWWVRIAGAGIAGHRVAEDAGLLGDVCVHVGLPI